MTKTLTEQWAIITPENCQEINTMISEYKKKIERLQEQLKEANELIKDYGDEYPNVVSDYIKKWGVK